MITIVADSHIPYLQGQLEAYATVRYCETMSAESVRDADVLLVRTRTLCDAALLSGSRVRLIGSTTIGTDHIDLAYCQRHGIEVVNAPGCNAPAVAQWVLATIAQWMSARSIATAEHMVLGVVGVGHVGSIVARWARQAGMTVLACDPPRAHNEGDKGFVSLEQIAAEADIITWHTPLTRSGQWPTWHLCDAALLRAATRCRLVINAARGAVCHSGALLAWQGDVALDCWEHEPHIDRALLNKAFIATPHIAGYSVQGKQRGTAMVLKALGERFGWPLTPVVPQTPADGAAIVTLAGIAATYNPLADTAMLRSQPEAFETLRNAYSLRHEVQ